MKYYLWNAALDGDLRPISRYSEPGFPKIGKSRAIRLKNVDSDKIEPVEVEAQLQSKPNQQLGYHVSQLITKFKASRIRNFAKRFVKQANIAVSVAQ